MTQSATSQRLIALLRAINVGGHTVKMEQLRALFVAMGFSNVETFIASGNVIFNAPPGNHIALELLIESQLQQALGYAVTTFVRTPAELAAVASYQPFAPADHAHPDHTLYIGFLKATPAADAQPRLAAYRTADDEFDCHGREFYWLRRRKVSESTFSGAQLERAIGGPATLRNLTTVRKLVARYPQ